MSMMLQANPALRRVATMGLALFLALFMENKAVRGAVVNEDQVEQAQAGAFAMNWIKALDEEKYEGCWTQVDEEFKAHFRNSLGAPFISIMDDASAQMLAAASDEEQFAAWVGENQRQFRWIGGKPPYKSYEQSLTKIERQWRARRWRVELETKWDLGSHLGTTRHTLIVSFATTRWQISDHTYRFGTIIDW